MNRALFALFVFFIASAFARSAAPEVTFVSPCECIGFHGKNRWIAKTDLSPVPVDASAIQSVTPSQIYAWEGLAPDVELTSTTERMPSEQKWYALTGRIIDVKVEADGDIHIALVDATGNNVGTVSAEIPVGPKWCEIRQTVFGDAEVSFQCKNRAHAENSRAACHHCYRQSVLRSYARASGSFKPATLAERLRGVGNPSSDEN